METCPRISVIVPAYNAERTIDLCLDALARQAAPAGSYEVLVVDDSSTDATQVRVQAHPEVRLLAQAHAGPAAARNFGANLAQGEIILFTDADCAPEPEWIERMAAPLRGAGKGTPPVGVKGAYRTKQRELVARFVQLEYEDKYDHMSRLEEIDFVDTYAAGYRRDVFLSSGGFDTHFPNASVEDQELSFRLARQGYHMVFVPDARVYHWGHARNVWGYARRKFKIGYWKVLVHRRHPAKLMRDSHTPQALRAQVALAGLGGGCLMGGLAWPALAWASALAALLFLVTTLPFVRKAWHKDRAVALLAPGLLLVRAVSLGFGFAAGLVGRPAWPRQANRP